MDERLERAIKNRHMHGRPKCYGSLNSDQCYCRHPVTNAIAAYLGDDEVYIIDHEISDWDLPGVIDSNGEEIGTLVRLNREES